VNEIGRLDDALPEKRKLGEDLAHKLYGGRRAHAA